MRLRGHVLQRILAMIPIAGSAYTYAYATMGELLAWIIGWDLVLGLPSAPLRFRVSWLSWSSKYCTRSALTLQASLVNCPFDPTPGIIKSAWLIAIRGPSAALGSQKESGHRRAPWMIATISIASLFTR